MARRLPFARLREWAHGGALALLDQGLVSGANFLAGVCLARRGGPSAYGAYMVMFAAFLLAANVYQALVLEPLSVLAYSLFPGRGDRYLRVVLRMHAIFTAGFLAIGASALALGRLLGMSALLTSTLEGLVVATPCVLLFWAARCFAYVEFDPAAAVRASLWYGGVLVPSVLAAAWWGVLTPRLVFGATAVAALAASLGLLRPRLPWGPPTHQEPPMREIWAAHWNFGRWGLGSVGLAWAQTNSISFISGWLLGLGATGGLNALVALLLPMYQVLTSATRLFLPRIAHLYTARGIHAVRQPVARLAAVLLVLSAVYALGISAFHSTILRHLFGERFMAYSWLVPVMSLHVVGCGGIAVCDIGFYSIRAPHASFGTKLLMAVVMIPVNTALTWKFGLTGAAFGVPAFSTLTAVLLAYRLRAAWRTGEAAAEGAC